MKQENSKPPSEGRKVCKECGEEKPHREFHKQHWGDGYNTKCKQCRNSQVRLSRSERKSQNPKREWLIYARQHAKQRSPDGDVSGISDDLELPDFCPVLGIPLQYPDGTGRGVPHVNSPSIDRFNSDLGYVPGNVRVISLRANRMKSDGNFQENRDVARWMGANLPKTPVEERIISTVRCLEVAEAERDALRRNKSRLLRDSRNSDDDVSTQYRLRKMEAISRSDEDKFTPIIVDQEVLPRDNQDENSASIRMRIRRCRSAGGRA